MKLKHLTLIISAVVLLSFTACQEVENPIGTETPEYTFSLNDAVEINGDLATRTVVQASLETDAFVPSSDVIFDNCVMGQDDFGNKRSTERVDLGKVIRLLKLNEKQNALLKEYNLAHRDCIESIMMKWREAVAPIIEKANAAKKLVMEALRKKEITRREAMAKLNAINKEMNAAIEKLGMRKAMTIAIEDCNKKLLANIKAMLTKEQLVIWNKYFPANSLTSSKG
jgi:hypothetical protein